MASSIGFPNANGYLQTDVGAVVANAYQAGLAFSAAGKVYTTTSVNTTDVYSGGLRMSATGQLVVMADAAPDKPYTFCQGFPQSKLTGAMIIQTDAAPLATDVFVQGIRVGALGVQVTIL